MTFAISDFLMKPFSQKCCYRIVLAIFAHSFSSALYLFLIGFR